MTQTPAEKAAFKLLRYFYPAESFLHPALVDDVKAIIQAAIDESLPKWLPIESAPTDGTLVLLCEVDIFTVGKWIYKDWAVQNALVSRPTHWMPLPQPPEDAR